MSDVLPVTTLMILVSKKTMISTKVSRVGTDVSLIGHTGLPAVTDLPAASAYRIVGAYATEQGKGLESRASKYLYSSIWLGGNTFYHSCFFEGSGTSALH